MNNQLVKNFEVNKLFNNNMCELYLWLLYKYCIYKCVARNIIAVMITQLQTCACH